MNIMEILRLTKTMSGSEISCKIDGTRVKSARIYYCDERCCYYIIQDYQNGYHPQVVEESVFKYKYAWSVGYGTLDDLKTNNVTDVKLISGSKKLTSTEPTYEIY